MLGCLYQQLAWCTSYPEQQLKPKFPSCQRQLSVCVCLLPPVGGNLGGCFPLVTREWSFDTINCLPLIPVRSGVNPRSHMPRRRGRRETSLLNVLLWHYCCTTAAVYIKLILICMPSRNRPINAAPHRARKSPTAKSTGVKSLGELAAHSCTFLSSSHCMQHLRLLPLSFSFSVSLKRKFKLL